MHALRGSTSSPWAESKSARPEPVEGRPNDLVKDHPKRSVQLLWRPRYSAALLSHSDPCYSTEDNYDSRFDAVRSSPTPPSNERLPMPLAQVNGIEIFYEERGSGYPLILSHEFAGSWESWKDQIRFFSRRYRVIAYNDRGYPPSSVPDDPAAYSEEQSVEDLLGLMDALAIPQAHIGGLSMGGAITLKFGIGHPDRCRSLTIAGAGSGTTNKEQFLKEQNATASVFEQRGSGAVGEFYTRGPARVQLQAKDPIAFEEFVELFNRHST